MNKIYVRNHVKVMTLVIEKTIKIYAKKIYTRVNFGDKK